MGATGECGGLSGDWGEGGGNRGSAEGKGRKGLKGIVASPSPITLHLMGVRHGHTSAAWPAWGMEVELLVRVGG